MLERFKKFIDKKSKKNNLENTKNKAETNIPIVDKKNRTEIETGSISQKLDLYLENSNTEQLKETKELVNKIAELKADRENVNRDLYFADTYDKSSYYEEREKYEKKIEELGKINPKALKIANEIVEFGSSPALDAKDEIETDLKIFNKEIDKRIESKKNNLENTKNKAETNIPIVDKKNRTEIETGSISQKLDLYLENSNTEQLKETKELVNKIAELKADRENVNRDLYFADTYDKSSYYEEREKYEKKIEELGKINPKALKIANEIVVFSSSSTSDARDEIDLKLFNKEIDKRIESKKNNLENTKNKIKINIPKKQKKLEKGNER